MKCKSSIILPSKCTKSASTAVHFWKFPGEACPQTPLESSPFGEHLSQMSTFNGQPSTYYSIDTPGKHGALWSSFSTNVFFIIPYMDLFALKLDHNAPCLSISEKTYYACRGTVPYKRGGGPRWKFLKWSLKGTCIVKWWAWQWWNFIPKRDQSKTCHFGSVSWFNLYFDTSIKCCLL